MQKAAPTSSFSPRQRRQKATELGAGVTANRRAITHPNFHIRVFFPLNQLERNLRRKLRGDWNEPHNGGGREKPAGGRDREEEKSRGRKENEGKRLREIVIERERKGLSEEPSLDSGQVIGLGCIILNGPNSLIHWAKKLIWLGKIYKYEWVEI